MHIKRYSVAALLAVSVAAKAAPMDLMTACLQAADSTPVVAQARARLQAERAGKDITRSLLAPRLFVDGSISRNNLDLTGFGTSAIHEDFMATSYSVTLTQPMALIGLISLFMASQLFRRRIG